MNFRVCKKQCKMQQLEVVSFDDPCIGNSCCCYVRFNMNGDNGRQCTFCVEGWDFTKQFVKKMWQVIGKKEVREELGHESDPAFITKRHIPLLDEIDMNNVSDLWQKDCAIVKKCPHCEKHCGNLVEKS